MFLRTGIGDDTSRRDGAAFQRPDKALLPFLAHGLVLHLRQRPGDTGVSAIDIFIDRIALAVLEPVLFIPDIQGCSLKLNVAAITADNGALLGC